jgi:DNA-binding transcriptional ArsR family regulator
MHASDHVAYRSPLPRAPDDWRFDHIPIWEYDGDMARTATTADAFNAVAEPARRRILDLLAGGERPVNDLVALLGVAQPQVSKHLAVLRQVGLVQVRGAGRQRMYRVNGYPLKQIFDWVKGYEQSWSQRFDLLYAVLAELKEAEMKQEGNGDGGSGQ